MRAGSWAPSPYTLLGITPTSNAEDIRAAYKKRALETHPDKGGDPEEFRRVKQAYEAINSGKAKLVGGPPRFNPEAAVSRSTSLSERLARKRPPQSMEEEIDSAFLSMPSGPTAKRVAERMAAGGFARQGPSLSARVSAQAASTKPKAPAVVSVVKLWEKLTKLAPKDRTIAIANLDAALQKELSQYLAKRQTTRSSGPATKTPATSQARPSPLASPLPGAAKGVEEAKIGSDSDSGESSSSESSGSSESANEKDVGGPGQRPVVTAQKHQRYSGNSPGEVG